MGKAKCTLHMDDRTFKLVYDVDAVGHLEELRGLSLLGIGQEASAGGIGINWVADAIISGLCHLDEETNWTRKSMRREMNKLLPHHHPDVKAGRFDSLNTCIEKIGKALGAALPQEEEKKEGETPDGGEEVKAKDPLPPPTGTG